MNQESYISLIIQNLSGEISSDDKSKLDAWISLSDENKEAAEKVSLAWLNADIYKADISIDEDQAWKSITTRVKEPTKSIDLNESNSKTTSKTISLWRIASIAASFLLILGFSYLFFNGVDNEPTLYATSNNETLEIVLPDGTNVSINENSQLSYLERENTRQVKLEGEAYFDVFHDKQRPFSVEANETKTVVLGTRFNVNANDGVEVSLYEGKVSFESKGNEKQILKPGELITYNIENYNLSLTSTDFSNKIAWKTKTLKFENTEITSVIKTVETYFDKNIELILKDGTCHFTSTFKNPNFEEVIEVLEYTYDMNFEASKNSDKLTILKCK